MRILRLQQWAEQAVLAHGEIEKELEKMNVQWDRLEALQFILVDKGITTLKELRSHTLEE